MDAADGSLLQSTSLCVGVPADKVHCMTIGNIAKAIGVLCTAWNVALYSPDYQSGEH